MNFENLPESWKVVRLGTLLHEVKSGDWGKESKFEDSIGCYVIRGTDFPACEQRKFSKIPFRYVKRTKYENNKPEEGGILIELSGGSKDQPVGRTLLLDEAILNMLHPLFFTNFVKLLRFRKTVLPRYIYHLLKWFYREGRLLLYQKQGGGQIRNFALNQFLNDEPIPLPPLPEQKRIVEILSLAEELIRKQKEAIALIDKILMAKFLEMFGDPATNPKGWGVRRLGEVAEIQSGQSAPQGEKYFKGGKYPFIRVQHIDNEEYKVKGRDLINELAIKDYRLKKFPKGTIIFPKSGAAIFLEKRAMLPFDAYIVSHLAAVNSISDTLDQTYLFYVLISKKLAEKKEEGYPTFNLSEIRDILIPLPPIELQKQFAQIVEEFEKKREEMQKILETLESLFKFFQKKAFTGELTAEWREKNKVEWELPKITERQAILLTTLYYYQNIIRKPAMVTVAMKYAFLLQQEAGLNLGYNFISYKYGPFSKEVYEDIEELEKNLLVERVNPKKDIEMAEIRLIDEFKDWVERIIDNLPQKIKDAIKTYTEKYGKMELNKLLDYVYAKYPEYAVKSKRKRKER